MGELVLLLLLSGLVALVSVVVRKHAALGASRPAPSDAALKEAAAALPRTPICEVGGGDWVRVSGRVEAAAGEPELRAPLSGAYGVAHRSVVLSSGPVRPPLVAPALDQRRAVDFLLRDDTGRARVVARGARPVLALRSVEAPRTRVDAWLERQGVPALAGAASHEGVLSCGDEVTVVGRARWEHDDDAPPSPPQATYRISARPRRLVLEPAPGRSLIVVAAEASGPEVLPEEESPAPARRRRELGTSGGGLTHDVPLPSRRASVALGAGVVTGLVALGLAVSAWRTLAAPERTADRVGAHASRPPPAPPPPSEEAGAVTAHLRASIEEITRASEDLAFGRDIGPLAQEQLDALLDLDAIVRASVGVRWVSLSDAKRLELRALLGEIVQRRVLAELEYCAEREVIYRPDEPIAGGRRVVVEVRARDALIDVAGAPGSIAYSLHEIDGAWRVIDVETDGRSMVSSYRRQILATMEDHGVEALVWQLRAVLARDEVVAERAAAGR